MFFVLPSLSALLLCGEKICKAERKGKTHFQAIALKIILRRHHISNPRNKGNPLNIIVLTPIQAYIIHFTF